MTAKDQIAAMLNELMGPGRNNEKNLDLNFRDTDVCKFYLAGFCPHDEFVNTKADMGACKYVHDENLRIAYRKSEHFEKLGYERQFYYFLQRINEDVKRKIEKNKERLALSNGAQNMDESTRKHLDEKIERLEKEMGEYVEIAEKAGSRGDLDKSQKFVKKAEEVSQELESVRKLLEPPEYTAGYKDPITPKPMRVCEVCASFLIIGDVQQRIDDHMNGRQHLGYAKIAATIEELKAKFRDQLTPEHKRGRSFSKSPERRRSRSPIRTDRGRSHKSESSHKSSRHEVRHHRSKNSRSQSRERHRHHSRSRSPHHKKSSRR